MLKHLHIHNYAIVESLELEFDEGMTVLSGETGAGKSILLGALGLTLGDRADSAVVRHGCKRAEISATFSTAGLGGVQAWLQERDLDMDDECIIRRTISSEGRSKGFINGQPAPVQSLRELGEQLVDIHGQHAHQSLLKRDIQRQMLDDYAQARAQAETVAEQFHQWQALLEERGQLRQAAEERQSKLELLRYQVDELSTLGLTVDELAELDEEHSRLANASRLQEGAQQAGTQLYENEQQSVVSQLEGLLSELQALQQLDPTLSPSCELIESAAIQAKEAAGELRHYLLSLEVEPARLEEVEQRLAAIHELSRKHRIEPQRLPELLEQLQQELNELESAETRLDGLDEAIQQAAEGFQRAAGKLSSLRGKGAAQLARQVTANMQELGMGGGQFSIELEACPPSAHGVEKVEFQVSANPGQPLQPLNKVASGGELSRISLAIQVIAAGREGIPTLIFDEVDVGVGGGVAEMVGRQLRRLSLERQVLCVTHQPQVAAQGHHHYRISKLSTDEATCTQVQSLAQQDRISEVARMLGGVEITEQTRSHAQEMIEMAQREA